jgi:hypothetical protein
MIALLVLAALSAFSGCAMLALSQERHWQAVSGATCGPPARVRRSGWLLITISLIMCIWRDGGSFAALLWPLMLMLGALATAATLTWQPAVLRFLTRLFQSAAPPR